MNLTTHWTGILALGIFFASYGLVVFEEVTAMRKSKPVLLAAGLIWGLLALGYKVRGLDYSADEQARHLIGEYGALFLFLLVAITYVNTLEERRVFDVLRTKMASLSVSYRQLFWLTGIVAFILSGLLDNLTTSLVVGASVIALGRQSRAFVVIGCVNIVVAANAGGAFSPFGDITTLMVWQYGKLSFWDFFALFFPSAVNWLIPAAVMQFWVPAGKPSVGEHKSTLKPGARGVILLFAATIVTAISFKNFLDLPPALGMMLGLGYLQIWAYFLQIRGRRRNDNDMVLDSFKEFERIEWDTLLFFFGIIFAVGGLGAMGYLMLSSNVLYSGLGPTAANVIIGALSAIVDNIPLMFAVLKMDPEMSTGQWLLITLTCGVGGSLLSIGSAAGVALMGLAKGTYTFSSHLRWAWVIAIGYVASISLHLVLNASLF